MTVTFASTSWTTWDLSAATLADAATTIAAMTEPAQTDWSHSSYTTHHNDAGVVTAADVTVHISVSMPNWLEHSAAPHEHQVEWDRAIAALHAHEQGHVDLVHTYLQHIDAHLVHGDETQAATVWAQTLYDLQAASDAYDASNGHGTQAGTTITVPPAP